MIPCARATNLDPQRFPDTSGLDTGTPRFTPEVFLDCPRCEELEDVVALLEEGIELT